MANGFFPKKVLAKVKHRVVEMSTKFLEVFLFPAKIAHSEISSLEQPSYSGVGMCDLLTFASTCVDLHAA